MSGHDKTQQITELNGIIILIAVHRKSKICLNIKEVFYKNVPGIIEIIYQTDGKVYSIFHEFKNNFRGDTQICFFESTCKN